MKCREQDGDFDYMSRPTFGSEWARKKYFGEDQDDSSQEKDD